MEDMFGGYGGNLVGNDKGDFELFRKELLKGRFYG